MTKLKDLVGKFRDLQTRAKGVTEQLKDKEEEAELTAAKLKRAEELMTTAKERIQVGHRMGPRELGVSARGGRGGC